MMVTSRLMAGAALLACAATASGCARIKDVKGYVSDDQLIATLQPGVDNKGSVQKTLGRPTVVSDVDSNRWFYVSQRTEQLAFFNPRPKVHQVLVVNFDAKGNLVKTEKLGVDQIVSVDASGDKTPTRGKDTSFWSNLFGDIGRYSPAGAGGGPE